MANYKTTKVVPLNEAISKTADAIREKLNVTNPLTWNPDEGFASYISDIQNSNIVKGTYTVSDRDIYANPVTITGLTFKPKLIITYSNSVSITSAYRCLFFAMDGLYSSYKYFSERSVYDGSEYFSITINSDGFTLSCNIANERINTGTWNYMAVG
jgi:hypothetical protein